MVKGPSELHPVFTVLLDGVTIDQEKLKGAVACVQDFVRHPLFTQRSFFCETGISMLNTAVTAADAVRNSNRFDPWGAINVEAGPVIADLKSCRENILSQRKAVKDTRERWFTAETVASSAVGESALRTTVRISDVVEVGDVQYVAEHEKLGLPCCSRSREKQEEASINESWCFKKNSFLFPARLLALLHPSLLWRKVLRNRGRGEMVAIAVMRQYSKGDTNNNLTVYLYKFLAF